MYIRWDPSLETGEPLIDAEHKLLVLLFRKLDAAIKLGASEHVVGATINEVRRFVEFHFISEENLMRETEFPDVEKHHAKHVELLAQLTSLLSKVAARKEFPEDLLYFLNQWLIQHIGSQDRGLADHVRDAALRPVAESIYREFLPTPGMQGAR